MSQYLEDTDEKLREKPKPKETVEKWSLPILRAYIAIAESERKEKTKKISDFPKTIKAKTIPRRVGKGRTEIREDPITQAQVALPLLATAKKILWYEAERKRDIETLRQLSTIKMQLSKDKNGILLGWQEPKPDTELIPIEEPIERK